jgi:hypothetical protein
MRFARKTYPQVCVISLPMAEYLRQRERERAEPPKQAPATRGVNPAPTARRRRTAEGTAART